MVPAAPSQKAAWVMVGCRPLDPPELFKESPSPALVAGGHSSYFALTRAVTAVPHAQSGPLGDYASYAQLYNVLGMPAGVVAATCVRPDEESDHPPSKDAVEQAAHMADQGSAGLPVGVLVVARHWREDVALAVMAALWRLGCAVAMPRRGALPCAARARPA